MVMPFLSVTVIGLLVGSAGHFINGRPHALWRAFFGAWAGFAAGGLLGLVLDVTLQSGRWVAVLGHTLAVVGAALSQRLELSEEISEP